MLGPKPRVHFEDRSKAQLEDLLSEHIVDAILKSSGPTLTYSQRDCAVLTQNLLNLSYQAHYDLGWSWQMIRDNLRQWALCMRLSIRIDLDKDGGSQEATEGETKHTRRPGLNKPVDDSQAGLIT